MSAVLFVNSVRSLPNNEVIRVTEMVGAYYCIDWVTTEPINVLFQRINEFSHKSGEKFRTIFFDRGDEAMRRLASAGSLFAFYFSLLESESMTPAGREIIFENGNAPAYEAVLRQIAGGLGLRGH